MVFLVVPNFMCEHGYHFRNSVLRYQRIEEGNALVTAKPGEEGI
jgi:hypothetical protein